MPAVERLPYGSAGSFGGWLVSPERPRAGAVLIHGYGGSKDSLLGLGLVLAEAGLVALCIDLPGHGEHPAPLSEGALAEVEAGLAYMRRYGRVGVVGHSLGGRLALHSSADAVVAVSPAVPKGVSPEGQLMFTRLPSPRVREPYPGYVLALLGRLGKPPVSDRPTLLISARYDIGTLREGIRELAAGVPAAEYLELETDLRAPVEFGHPLADYLPYWLNHGELVTHPEVYRRVPAWLGRHLG